MREKGVRKEGERDRGRRKSGRRRWEKRRGRGRGIISPMGHPPNGRNYQVWVRL